MRGMGLTQSRRHHAKSVQVSLQLRHGNGAVHATETVQYFDGADLIRRIWVACVAAGRAQHLLLATDDHSARVALRSVHTTDCVVSERNRINLIEHPEQWSSLFGEEFILIGHVTVVADLLAEVPETDPGAA